MASKVTVAGKHALTVRIGEEDYRQMRRLAAEKNLSVNEMIAAMAVKETKREMKRILKE